MSIEVTAEGIFATALFGFIILDSNSIALCVLVYIVIIPLDIMI